MNKVIIYSTTTCPFCLMLKEYLLSKGILFEEKMVDMDDAALKEMASVSNGFLGVPFTVITTDDNKTETVLGFDKGKLDSVLKIV